MPRNPKSTDSIRDTGGDKEARTPDLGSAIAALYQLSYIPLNKANDIILSERCKGSILVMSRSFGENW